MLIDGGYDDIMLVGSAGSATVRAGRHKLAEWRREVCSRALTSEGPRPETGRH